MDFVVKWVLGVSCLAQPSPFLSQNVTLYLFLSSYLIPLDIVGHGMTWSYSFCYIEPLDGF